MPSRLPIIKANTNQENIDKMKIIAERNKRSLAKELEFIIEKHIREYETENGEIILPPKPTRKEAWEAQKQTLRDSRHKPVMETLKDSWGHGKDYGDADK